MGKCGLLMSVRVLMHLAHAINTKMPWLALPFENRGLKQKLAQQFNVRGIPMLVVLDKSGKLVTANGRGEVDR